MRLTQNQGNVLTQDEMVEQKVQVGEGSSKILKAAWKEQTKNKAKPNQNQNQTETKQKQDNPPKTKTKTGELTERQLKKGEGKN